MGGGWGGGWGGGGGGGGWGGEWWGGEWLGGEWLGGEVVSFPSPLIRYARALKMYVCKHPVELLTTLNFPYNKVNKKDYVNFMLKPKKHLVGNKKHYTFASVNKKQTSFELQQNMM